VGGNLAKRGFLLFSLEKRKRDNVLQEEIESEGVLMISLRPGLWFVLSRGKS